MALLQLYSKSLYTTISLWFLFSFGTTWSASQEPLLVNQIVINPKDSRIVYAATRPQGVLRSMDQGMNWRPARKGLMTTSVYHIVIHPTNPKILFLGTFGGGVYKSENGGEDWFEVNHGLGNTNIHALVINPLQPDQVIVSTSTGELFKSDNSGKSWAPFSEGLPFFSGEVIATVLIFPKDPGGFYLAQGGLFRRPFSTQTWQPVKTNLDREVITTLAYEPHKRTLYAGTMKGGAFRATFNQEVQGSNTILGQSHLNWTPIEGPFQKQWIRLTVIDPLNPSVIYVAVVGQGLYKSTDEGASWKEINAGFLTKEVESLAIDPKDSKLLYAGMHNDGLFISRDGGETWTPPKKLAVESVQQIIASLGGPSPPSESQEPRLVPPLSFAGCNRCHGWTDPLLNQKATYWRVSPNNRDWRPTVLRMSPGAGLTPEEEEGIIRFLTEYSRQHGEKPQS